MNGKFANPRIKDGFRVNGEVSDPVMKAARSLQRASLRKRADRAKFMGLMFQKATDGHWHGVLSLVNPEVINMRDGQKRSLLMIAAMQGNLDAVKELVKKEAYKSIVDNCERSALIHAMLNGHHEVAKWLKENGADWKSDLEVAVRDRRKMLVYSMIDVLGVTGDDVAEAEAKFDPKRGPAVSHRVKRLLGSDADAVFELGLTQVPMSDFRDILESAGKRTGGAAEAGPAKKEASLIVNC